MKNDQVDKAKESAELKLTTHDLQTIKELAIDSYKSSTKGDLTESEFLTRCYIEAFTLFLGGKTGIIVKVKYPGRGIIEPIE